MGMVLLERRSQEAASTPPLERVARAVVPLWTGQTTLARSEMEDAITALTGRFSAMQLNLREAVQSAEQLAIHRGEQASRDTDSDITFF